MMADGSRRLSRDFQDDPFSNFQFEPPRGHGPLRAFTRRNKYRYNMTSVSSRDKFGSGRLGSSTSLASLTGSSQNLLDPAKMMSMQEEARSRTISAEVMKNRLYESVVTSPRKRRFSMRMDYSMPAGEKPDPETYARMVQSLPVTPAHSQNVSPIHSPTSNQRFFFGFFSRGATPHCLTPEELEEEEMEQEGESWKGLASLFKPQPRYIPGARFNQDEEGGEHSMECDMERTDPGAGFLAPAEKPGILLRTVPRLKKRSTSPVGDEEMNTYA